MAKLLLVEDDRSLGETLKERLEREGHGVDWAQTIAGAYGFLKTHVYDLFIIDLSLPDGEGFDFAKSVKKTSSSPFLFMTALNTAENRLLGYELGAEEFIPKPFHLKELMLRVGHVLREHAVPGVLRYRDRVLDVTEGSIKPDVGEKIYLSDRDLKMVRLLIKKSPRVVSRDEILALWVGDESFPTTRTVDNAVVRLRQSMGDLKGEVIRSVRGAGYQWILENH